MSHISFRQVQRIEHGQSDISWCKLSTLLSRFGFEPNVAPTDPNWEVLCAFGLALDLGASKRTAASIRTFLIELDRAMTFVLEHRDNSNYARHADCIKALLLALKLHYPALFRKLEKQNFRKISDCFKLNQIEGRHIKLRNISLGLLARRLKKLQASAERD